MLIAIASYLVAAAWLGADVRRARDTGSRGWLLPAGLALLLVLRFFVGLGLGAELPVASTYVSEFAPARIRGRVIVVLEAFWAVGWTASAVIGYFVVPASENGWRWAFALGAIPAAYALVVRLGTPVGLVNADLRAEVDTVARAFDEVGLLGAMDAIGTARERIAGNVPPLLALEALAISLRLPRRV